MALSPGRPPDDRRDRHEKPPVTAPSHKPTGGYNIPACPLTEILDRIAALNRRSSFNTVKTQEEAAKQTMRIRRDSLMITAKLEEDNINFVKKQAATTRRIQGMVERLKTSDELFKCQVKKFQEELRSKQDG